MPHFTRSDALFSLCGVNCGLCAMRPGDYDPPGCGQGNKPCATALCGMEHGVEYCFPRPQHPCPLYDRAEGYDSLITYLHQKADLRKATEIGMDAYAAQQREKVQLSEALLCDYDSGREKVLFCLAVNPLDSADIRQVLQESAQHTAGLSAKGKAKYMSNRLREMAKGHNIEPKLQKIQSESNAAGRAGGAGCIQRRQRGSYPPTTA